MDSPRDVVRDALAAYWHQEWGSLPARSFRPEAADAILAALAADGIVLCRWEKRKGTTLGLAQDLVPIVQEGHTT